MNEKRRNKKKNWMEISGEKRQVGESRENEKKEGEERMRQGVKR